MGAKRLIWETARAHDAQSLSALADSVVEGAITAGLAGRITCAVFLQTVHLAEE